MTAEALERIRSEMLVLTKAERAELASELIKSLDSPGETGVDAAWEEEIQHRIAEVDAGEAELHDREELSRRMRSRPRAQ